MNRALLVLLLFALAGSACGKYGPPEPVGARPATSVPSDEDCEEEKAS